MDQIAWLPLCAGLTGVGLVISFLLLRRKGAAAGLRATAWSLLPMAAYLTGALPVLWNIGSSVVGFVTGLVFSPSVWIGVALTGLAVVLYLVSGVLRGRNQAKAAPARERSQAQAAQARPGVTPAATATQPLPTRTPKQAPAKKAADDDFSDIEDILKRRGIG
ncbi:cellulose synthase [Spongiactinospora sp. TRM90649]|uniref:cellulose synthase n=1 Tax=Spongiactinospora sp. TRM90649 TaxID=3031114 RepID=UPI0023F812BE|nr:cellulose synthase [Spongiactinospora sp. TRM90649]MDF5753793.1 cellulose synthase [Spongiactinospora sp. TRM90649]